MKYFKDKVAVITGAASGIGYGLAERAAREGMKVVLAGINEDTLQRAEKSLKANGATTLVVKTDVSKAEDVKALARKTVDTFGEVHLLFNNAGVVSFSTAWESLTDWQWILDVNLWGVIYGIHYFVPIMLEQDTECHIINTGSSGSLTIGPILTPYVVSKHAVLALTESLYQELAMRTDKIGVSALIPGFTKSAALDAERNRPRELRNRPGEEIDTKAPGVADFIEFYKGGFGEAILPEEVADIAFDAIEEEKLYIFAGNEGVKPMIRERMEDILHQRNPSVMPLET